MLQKKKIPQTDQNRPSQGPNFSAFNIATDLLAGILVGLFIGLYLDKFLNLAPLFTIICSILGVFASISMIYKRMR